MARKRLVKVKFNSPSKAWRKLRLGRSFRNFSKTLSRFFKGHRKFVWVLIAAALAAGVLLFFRDYSGDSREFESCVRNVLKSYPQAVVSERQFFKTENWHRKWSEVKLLVALEEGGSADSVFQAVHKKIPKKFKLFKKTSQDTPVIWVLDTEYRRNNVPIGFLRIESWKKQKAKQKESKESEPLHALKSIFSIFMPKPKPKPLVPPPPVKPTAKPPVPEAAREVKKAVPPAKIRMKAKIAIVIDDVGSRNDSMSLLFSMPSPVTVAIMPYLEFSKQAARLAKKYDYEVILHQPVEAMKTNGQLGPGAIFVNDKPEQITRMVGRNLNSLSNVTGSNNHMGSRGTRDYALMRAYLTVLQKRGLLYLDSRTIRGSIGCQVARSMGVSCLERDVFLDNSSDPSYIRAQLRELMAMAERKGYAIGIGHDRPNTLKVLREEISEMEREGFEIVQLKDLL